MGTPVTPPVPDDWAEHAREMTNDELMAYYDQPRAIVAAWRKRTGMHKPRGGRRTLPAQGRWDESLTLTQLAAACGWGSVCRFTQALRRDRPAIYAKARANGLAKRGRYLRPGQ